MNIESIETLLPEIAAEQHDAEISAPEEVLPIPAKEAASEPAITSIEENPGTTIEAPQTPPSASRLILGIKVDGEPFLEWALESSINFLDLADLDPLQTVDRLRGVKEEKIRDKIQMSNSMLVLLANYGSENNNAGLVSACELYAAKMKTIIKRLCL